MISETDWNRKRYDVCGIGSPLLDFIVEVDEGLLAEIDMKKGQMHLIDEGQSKRILGMIEGYRVKTAPGGSSANTLAGVSALGGSADRCTGDHRADHRPSLRHVRARGRQRGHGGRAGQPRLRARPALRPDQQFAAHLLSEPARAGRDRRHGKLGVG